MSTPERRSLSTSEMLYHTLVLLGGGDVVPTEPTAGRYKVTDPQQAKAIAASEVRRYGGGNKKFAHV